MARLTPRGRLTEFAVPPSATSGGTGDITSGPDGNVWFTRPGGTVDRVTLDGIVTEFTVPRTGSDPEGIAVGPDGRVYVCDRYNWRIQIFDSDGNLQETWSGFVPAGIVFERAGS